MRDGTLNRTGDNDEEWIVEMAIPLAALGIHDPAPGTRIPFAVRRCDVGARGPGACGGFGAGDPRGELVFEAASVAGVDPQPSTAVRETAARDSIRAP